MISSWSHESYDLRDHAFEQEALVLNVVFGGGILINRAEPGETCPEPTGLA